MPPQASPRRIIRSIGQDRSPSRPRHSREAVPESACRRSRAGAPRHCSPRPAPSKFRSPCRTVAHRETRVEQKRLQSALFERLPGTPPTRASQANPHVPPHRRAHARSARSERDRVADHEDGAVDVLGVAEAEAAPLGAGHRHIRELAVVAEVRVAQALPHADARDRKHAERVRLRGLVDGRVRRIGQCDFEVKPVILRDHLHVGLQLGLS